MIRVKDKIQDLKYGLETNIYDRAKLLLVLLYTISPVNNYVLFYWKKNIYLAA